VASVPVPFTDFGGGLNLTQQPGNVAFRDALDCLNVELTELGAVKQRPGYARLTAGELTSRADSLSPFYKSDGTRQLVVGCGTRLEALNTSGEVIDSETGLAEGPYTFARFGTPNAETVYAGNGTDTLRKWDGAEWTAPTATVNGVASQPMPTGRLLAVDPDSNRLAVAGFETTTGGPDGTTSSPSHVYFSEPGDAETWDTTNNVIVSPGDGEKITALVSNQGKLFAFKETSYTVFWGESTDQGGGAVFNNDTFNAGVGAVGPRAACPSRHGIFFVDRTGVYLVGQSAARLVSGALDPFFTGRRGLNYFRSKPLNHNALDQVATTFHNERLYVAVPTGTSAVNNRLLVHDPRYGWWAIWDIPAAALVSFRVGAQAELAFAYASNAKRIGRLKDGSLTYQADDCDVDGTGGVAITSRWRSGWTDLGSPSEKNVHNAKVWGTGAMTMTVYRNYDATGGLSDTLTFGQNPDVFADGSDSSDTFADGSDDGDLFVGPELFDVAVWSSGGMATRYSVEFSNSALRQHWSANEVVFFLTGDASPQHIRVRGGTT
jgi:hypothetical protein